MNIQIVTLHGCKHLSSCAKIQPIDLHHQVKQMSKHTKQSKFLSLILRHQPEILNLKCEVGGWVDIGLLIENSIKYGRQGTAFNREMINEIVKNCPKQRYAISECGEKIRANQGHSTDVDMQFEPVRPPQTLLHGTSLENWEKIKFSGIRRMSRQHVHLTEHIDTAAKVGSRHGEVVVTLVINSEKMHADGFKFYKSENNVWLTDNVPVEYIVVFEED